MRPISLTNTVYRLINYSLTQRLMPIINRIIWYPQQAFLHQRNIHYNIETTRIIAQNILKGSPQATNNVFLTDLKKAFDSVNHESLLKILRKLDFPITIIQSIYNQSHGTISQILNGKNIHQFVITMNRGVRQGLPFSPLIFNLMIEPLIRQLHNQLNGINYHPHPTYSPDLPQPKSSTQLQVLAFADDIIIFNQDLQDFQHGIAIINLFSRISNLHLNEKKSIIYCHPVNIDTIQNYSNDHHLNIKVQSPQSNPVYLGIPLITIKWKTKLAQLQQRIRKTLFMDLNLLQRVIAINTYIFSTIYYYDQHHPISNKLLQPFIKYTQQEILKFLPHPIANNRLRWYEPHSTGGMGMIDLVKQLQGRRGFYIQYMIQPLTPITTDVKRIFTRSCQCTGKESNNQTIYD